MTFKHSDPLSFFVHLLWMTWKVNGTTPIYLVYHDPLTKPPLDSCAMYFRRSITTNIGSCLSSCWVRCFVWRPAIDAIYSQKETKKKKKQIEVAFQLWISRHFEALTIYSIRSSPHPSIQDTAAATAEAFRACAACCCVFSTWRSLEIPRWPKKPAKTHRSPWVFVEQMDGFSVFFCLYVGMNWRKTAGVGRIPDVCCV